MTERTLPWVTCGACGFERLDPAEVLDHMLETGHCLAPEMVTACRTNPQEKAELLGMLKEMQANPAGGRQLAREELEELALNVPEVEETLTAIQVREEKKRQVH